MRVLTDPGAYTSAQDEVRGISIVLITHEHPDHLHIDSLKRVLANNPSAKVVTNRGVGDILRCEAIPFQLLEHGQEAMVSGLRIEGHGESHAFIYQGVKEVVNTGYLLAGRFFYPGDAFYDLGKTVEVLALPVAGPWMKIAEAIDYAKALAPRNCFPVHDGILKHLGPVHALPSKELSAVGITFTVPELGVPFEV